MSYHGQRSFVEGFDDMKIRSENLLREQRVAEILGVTVRCVQGWRSRGVGLRFIHVGRLARYQQADVDAFITRNAVETTSPSGGRAE